MLFRAHTRAYPQTCSVTFTKMRTAGACGSLIPRRWPAYSTREQGLQEEVHEATLLVQSASLLVLFNLQRRTYG